ncbi:hypothetical protein VE02_02776 [Pseudogymnoascus sp. 03VT05]|nr:hypothetical protein VE02_02776 [Pseudogymnoascus sp. 03VT05]
MLPGIFPALALILGKFSPITLSTYPVRSDTPAASTVYIEDTQTTFSINLPDNSTDVYFYFSSPSYSWVAVGVGSDMAGSLMMIMYSASDNQHVTISPRIATGHSEPTFTTDVQVEVLDGSSIQNGFFVMNALCRGCRSWNGGSLNLSTTVQPFIYAVGPNGVPISSDSQTAGLRRHDSFGHFTMNMVQATGLGGVPLASNITSGATLLGSLVKDGDKASKAHGFLMALVALVIIPFDVIIIGLFKWPMLHVFTGSLVLFLVLTAMGLGIYVSTEYNRSKHFDSSHQVIGFISVGGLLVLASIGIYLRRMQKTADKSDKAGQNSKFTSIHTWAARCIWLLLIINNGL